MANSKFCCRGCRDYFPNPPIKINGGNFHSFSCATQYGRKAGDKLLAKQRRLQTRKARAVIKEKDEKHKKLRRKVKLENTRHQHKITQPVFNRMRVLQELKWFADRGIEPYCISCTLPLGGDQWCCGHFKTAGGNSRIRYDPRNTYLQHNRNCNMAKSGDIEGYKKGLVIRFGARKAEDIIAYCEENRRARRWTGEELEKLRLECRATIKALENEAA